MPKNYKSKSFKKIPKPQARKLQVQILFTCTKHSNLVRPSLGGSGCNSANNYLRLHRSIVVEKIRNVCLWICTKSEFCIGRYFRISSLRLVILLAVFFSLFFFILNGKYSAERNPGMHRETTKNILKSDLQYFMVCWPPFCCDVFGRNCIKNESDRKWENLWSEETLYRETNVFLESNLEGPTLSTY